MGGGVITTELSTVERQVDVLCAVVKLKKGDEHYDASKCYCNVSKCWICCKWYNKTSRFRQLKTNTFLSSIILIIKKVLQYTRWGCNIKMTVIMDNKHLC